MTETHRNGAHAPQAQTQPQERPHSDLATSMMGRRGGPGGMMLGKVEKAKDARGTVRRLWDYLRKQRVTLLWAGVIVVANTLLTLVGPYLLARAIDGYIIPGDLPGLWRIGGLMLVVYALNSLTTWLQAYIMAGAAQQTVRDLRDHLFARLQTFSLRYFDSHPHGDLMSRLTNDIENVNAVLSENVTQLISGLLSLVGVAAMMLWLNPYLALVSLTIQPLLVFTLARWVATRTRTGFRDQQAALGTLNGLIEETVTGQRVVKAYSREPTVMADFDRQNTTLRTAATRAQIYAGFMGPTMNFISNLGLAILVSTGGWLAVNDLATVGVIAAFINYARQFGRPLNEIANLYNQLQSAVAGAERVFATIDEEAELVDVADALSLTALRGDVRFENVCFSYDGVTPVLKAVSLHAKPGEIVALVGPTGAGKTTIVNLLTRFYDIDSGHIVIDGHDLGQLNRHDLRRQLGIVLQDTFLFAASVLENIRYGRLDATDDEVIAAAKLANADQFIHRLPQGYNTPLSERGSNLSQGQRQLLAIARAILANPKILILDEATSSVDTRTEQHIQEAMLRLMAGRTSFVIAHRLSTIRNADQILVINHGELIERGTHEALLAQEGFYYQLYTSQFRANAPAAALIAH
ncbi:MAG: ABC transporter ATP-binding protein [Caldilineaceae bacterium]